MNKIGNNLKTINPLQSTYLPIPTDPSLLTSTIGILFSFGSMVSSYFSSSFFAEDQNLSDKNASNMASSVPNPPKVEPNGVSRMSDRPKREISPGIYSYKLDYDCDVDCAPLQMIRGAKKVYIGDTHGNTLRLIFDVASAGGIRFTNEKIWPELVEIISSSANLTDEQYQRFIDILVNNMVVPAGSPQIILLGDLLGDRQSNDILTLRFLYELNRKNLKYKIILSNHDLLFLHFYLLNDVSFINRHKASSQSVLRFEEFCQMNTDKGSERLQSLKVDNLIQNYLSHLTLFDYHSISQTFACHASVEIEQLEELAKLIKACHSYLSFKKEIEENGGKLKGNINSLFQEIYNRIQLKYSSEGVFKNKNKAEFSSIMKALADSFEDIKQDRNLLELFLKENVLIHFCENRTLSPKLHSKIPGLRVVIQGHDCSEENFHIDPSYDIPFFPLTNNSQFSRFSLDNHAGKSSIYFKCQEHDPQDRFRKSTFLLARYD